MHPLIARLVAHAPVVTDGAWGTQLQALGLPTGACADEWNLSHPDLVERVARGYGEAGSQVLLTNTFRAHRLALQAHGLAKQVDEINRASVAISRRAAGSALVFASIGPSGQRFLPGQVPVEELREAFAEQARFLAAAGADALVLETFLDLDEAQVALAAARETGLPVVVCMVFAEGKPGVTPEQAAVVLTAAGADVMGANCGQGIAGFVPICRRLRASTGLPIWIKPNAGLPEIVDGKLVYRTTPEEFAAYGPVLRAAGADFLGGCCGTTPEFIRALVRRLRPA